jgi:hypothetical protein
MKTSLEQSLFLEIEISVEKSKCGLAESIGRWLEGQKRR